MLGKVSLQAKQWHADRLSFIGRNVWCHFQAPIDSFKLDIDVFFILHVLYKSTLKAATAAQESYSEEGKVLKSALFHLQGQ